MHKLTVDPSMRSQLDELHEQVELCDETGKTLGYFLPADLRDHSWYDWAQSQFTEEELNLASQQPGGRTTAELLGRLSSL